MEPLALLPREWWFPSLKGLREGTGTYARFPLDRQPRVGAGDGTLGWLEVEPLKSEWAIRGGELRRALNQTELNAVAAELPALPAAIRRLAERADLQDRVRSATGCYLDLGDFAVRTSTDDGWLLHFLSDQQWCAHWLLFVDKSGNEAVLATRQALGYKEEPGEPPSPTTAPLDGSWDLSVCADSFAEFLYRYWIENELFFAISDGRRLDGQLMDYAAALAKA